MSQPPVKEFQMNVASGQASAISLYEDTLTVPALALTTCSFGGAPSADAIFYQYPAGQWVSGSPPYNTITIPPGIAKIKVQASLHYEHSHGTDPDLVMILVLKKNGSYTINGQTYCGYGEGSNIESSVMNDDTVHLLTPWIPVVPGDTFQIVTRHNYSNFDGNMNAKDLRFQIDGMVGTISNERGYLWAWGNNTYGQLGTGNTTNYSSPVRVGALNDWVDIRSDDGTVVDGKAVAIRDDGSIWAWGENSNGNIGDGTTVNKSSPTQIGAGTNWAFITENDQSAYAIKTDGTLWAWGRNGNGELGVGNTTSYSSPIQVGSLNNWKHIDNYDRKTFAVKTDGSLWAWGYNGSGNLGTGNTVNYSSPVRIGALNDWTTVTCGVFHTFAIKTDGSLWVWGNNTSGALGVGNTVNYSSPVRVGALNDWAMVSGGINYTLAIKTDGSLWGWGLNTGGQLGTGNTVNYSSPVRIGALNDWKFVDAGDTASAAIKTDGSLWAWADNSYGALGLGNTISRSSPTRVGSDNDWITVNTSRSMTLGIKAS